MRRFALIATLGLMAAAPAVSARAPKAAPAGAPTPARTSGALGASNLPLDISSDNSEQFQTERRAVWWGNVEAIQGTSRMRTPRLTAFFSPRDPNAPKAPAGAGLGADVGQVERIEAEGPVFYVTPTQKAKGDHATYMADSDTITMTGNVVLTQDQNVATGDKLVIEQKTGHSTLTSNPGKGSSPQRVRAVLYPSQSQNTTGPAGAAPTAQKPAGHP